MATLRSAAVLSRDRCTGVLHNSDRDPRSVQRQTALFMALKPVATPPRPRQKDYNMVVMLGWPNALSAGVFATCGIV